jgi:tetratricopeptide (TPR) repeat protein
MVLSIRWKLLRALNYAVEFSAASESDKNAYAHVALEIVREGLESFETDIQSTDADRARFLFWSSIVWGSRARRAGGLTLVREGAANRIYDYASESLRLDPSVDEGGALRLLARLHGTLPRVPFVSGWVDRSRALPLAERAVASSPGHPGSQLVLALTLLEQAPERRDEAKERLRQILSAPPRPESLVEDLTIQRQAEQQLAILDAEGRTP